MEIIISSESINTTKKAAEKGTTLIQDAINLTGKARIILATGTSQIAMLAELISQNIDWNRVTAFHLDEYIGLDESHPASFAKYLKDIFTNLLPLKSFYHIDGKANPEAECKRLNDLISSSPVDVAFIGIGENGHLAFNDPPADFKTEDPYKIVKLDDACRRQQVSEGWFILFDDVPRMAISMPVKQIMKSKSIICTVPDKRKALAVKKALEGEITPNLPASNLQNHPDLWLYLDSESASLLRNSHNMDRLK